VSTLSIAGARKRSPLKTLMATLIAGIVMLGKFHVFCGFGAPVTAAFLRPHV
jgi:hypothetical protein